MHAEPILKVEDLQVNYGAIVALRGIDLEVKRGDIVTLIGANGAGKSTTMNSLMGIVRKKAGKVTFEGQDISQGKTLQIVKNGMCLVPEGRQIFPELSVEGNLEMGAYLAPKDQIEPRQEMVYNMFPRLFERKKQPGGTLSGGEQQMLAVGRALMANPKLIMLDEPSMGLAPNLVQEIFAMIQRIRDSGTSILLVEQNARMALSISDYAYVLETGRIVMEGPATELLNSDTVRKAYLGG